MKVTIIKLLLVTLILNLSSCKKGNSSFTDYQFAEKTPVITCVNTDIKLLNEALYSFEKDITPFFDKQQNNLNRAYNTFTKKAANRQPDYTKFVSKHSVAIASALKDSGLIGENGVNYNNPIIKCIAENMQEDDLKTTFNALVSTNSMRKDLFNPALQNKVHKVAGDKYLSMYVALEYFYAEIVKIDFSKVDFNRPEAENTGSSKPISPLKPDNSKVDFNKRPAKQ